MKKILVFFFLASVLLQSAAYAQSRRQVNEFLALNYSLLDYDEFIYLCDSFLLEHPKMSHDIYGYRLMCNYNNSMLPEAISDLDSWNKTSAQKSKSKLDLSNYITVLDRITPDYMLATQYFEIKEYAGCAAALSQLNEKVSYFWQSHYYLAQCLDSLGLHDSATAVIRNGARVTVHPHLISELAKRYFKEKEYSMAFYEANWLIENGYEDAELHLLVSEIYFFEWSIEKAASELQIANNLSPGNPAFLRQNARISFTKNQYELTAQFYKKARQKAIPLDSTDKRFYLYSSLHIDEEPSDCIAYIFKDSITDIVLYSILIESGYGYPDIPIRFLNKAIKSFPKESLFYAQRAELLWGINHEDPQVKKDYYTLIELNPDTIFWYKKLHTYVMYRDSKEASLIRVNARKNMERVLTSDSAKAANWFQVAEAYNLLDFIYESKKMKRLAIQYYTEAIARDSSMVVAYTARAELERWVNEDSDAYLSDLQKALSLQENWFYRSKIAHELFRIGKKEEAILEMTEAIELYPYQLELYRGRASFYSMMDKNEKAAADDKKVEELKKALESAPPPPPF